MVGSRLVTACHRSAEVRASLLRVRRGIFWGVVAESDISVTVDMAGSIWSMGLHSRKTPAGVAK